MQTKEQKAVSQGKWYAANRAEHRANVAERNMRVRKENQEKILTYLKEHPCVDCGETDVRVLHFDHVRGIKVTEVSKMVHCAWKWETIETEIEKCDVRCANDHMRRHFIGC